ncbi:hypothetical protein FB451DRAFT_1443433 [Mycena latifolia]|nr:hypothetical protein FB451DRAFT_1443433 [Mycena latifolia]
MKPYSFANFQNAVVPEYKPRETDEQESKRLERAQSEAHVEADKQNHRRYGANGDLTYTGSNSRLSTGRNAVALYSCRAVLRYKTWLCMCGYSGYKLSSSLKLGETKNQLDDGYAHLRRYQPRDPDSVEFRHQHGSGNINAHRSCFEVDRHDGRASILLGMLLIARLLIRIEFQPLSSTAILSRIRWRVLNLCGLWMSDMDRGHADPSAYSASMLFMYTVKEIYVSLKQTTINKNWTNVYWKGRNRGKTRTCLEAPETASYRCLYTVMPTSAPRERGLGLAHGSFLERLTPPASIQQ